MKLGPLLEEILATPLPRGPIHSGVLIGPAGPDPSQMTLIRIAGSWFVPRGPLFVLRSPDWSRM